MFSAPRFIAIDDELAHLNAIVATLQRLGTACFGMHYDAANVFDPSHFAGVRCLFVDLHLTPGVPLSQENQHYGIIAQILETNISKVGGPFILIVWTSQDQLCLGLRDYLDTHLTGDQAHARPLAVLPLPKEKFINPASGVPVDPQLLETEVKNLIWSIPQLAALIAWEADVLSAAGTTLAALLNLVPADKRITGAYAEQIDTILSRLACEAVGKANVATDVRGAVAKSLAPILSDRIMNQEMDGNATFWATAVTKHGDNEATPASPEEAGMINRMLHLAVPPMESVAPGNWGAVATWPFTWEQDADAPYLGFTAAEILDSEFKIQEADRTKCRPVLVRVGAACDSAQNNAGPITYLLGMEIPVDVKQNKKLSDAIWKSPAFVLTDGTPPFRLFVHLRFPISFLRAQSAIWNATYRIREQLLTHLLVAASNYAARPGVVSLPSK